MLSIIYFDLLKLIDLIVVVIVALIVVVVVGDVFV